MLLQKKQGYPQDDELVLCTVLKISPHSVFVRLEEYGKNGMIHISEVSPGRIRNIRDFVKEGKVIVCKVLRVVQEKGYIDLSLRRVNELQRKTKLNEVKQEQKAEKIIEHVAKKLGREALALFNEVNAKASAHDSLYACFESLVAKGQSMAELGVAAEAAKELDEAIRQRVKLPEAKVAGDLTLRTYDPDGIELIKKSLKTAKEQGATILYEGGGRYRISVTASDYKSAEKALNKATENAVQAMKKSGGTAEFSRAEIKK